MSNSKPSLSLTAPSWSPYVVGAGIGILSWLVFLIVSGSASDYAWIGWTFYMFMALQISFIRGYVRTQHNIYGNMFEDFFGALVMYPNIVSQLHYQSKEPAPSNDVYRKPVTVA